MGLAVYTAYMAKLDPRRDRCSVHVSIYRPYPYKTSQCEACLGISSCSNTIFALNQKDRICVVWLTEYSECSFHKPFDQNSFAVALEPFKESIGSDMKTRAIRGTKQ